MQDRTAYYRSTKLENETAPEPTVTSRRPVLPESHPHPLRITVRTDLPPALKAARGKLANEAYKLRKEKGLSTKIVVREANVVLLWKEKGSTSWNKFVD